MCFKCILLPIIMTIPFLAVGIAQKKSIADVSLTDGFVIVFALLLGTAIMILSAPEKKKNEETKESAETEGKVIDPR